VGPIIILNVTFNSPLILKAILFQDLSIMGVYLSEPNKTKNINTGENSKLSFISAEMQGLS